MTQIRRFVFVIVAACTALAVGIALGGGPLQGDTEDNSARLEAERDDLRARLADAEDAQVLDEALVEARAPGIVAGRLEGRSVTVLSLPGTSEDTVSALEDAVTLAGGTVAVSATVSPDLVDPGKKTYVDSVATNSISGEPGLAQLVTGETYDRIGALIARAYVGAGENTALDDTATQIDSELEGARLLEVQGEPGRRGSLVMLVGPTPSGDKATLEAQQVILTAISRALIRGSDGFLLAQPTGDDPARSLAAAQTGDEDLADDTSWSVLNTTAGAAAQVTAAYALAAAVSEQGGTYGLDSGTAVLPPGLPIPTD